MSRVWRQWNCRLQVMPLLRGQTDGRTDRGDSPLSSPHPKPHTASIARRRAATSTVATDSVARRIQMALLPSFTMLVRSVGVRVALEDVYLFGLDTGGIESVLSSRLSSSGRSLQCVRKTWAKGGSKREVRIRPKAAKLRTSKILLKHAT